MTDIEKHLIERTRAERVTSLIEACKEFEKVHEFDLYTNQRKKLVEACVDHPEACKIIEGDKTYQDAKAIILWAHRWVWDDESSIRRMVMSVRDCEGKPLWQQEAILLYRLGYNPFLGPFFWCIEVPFLIVAFAVLAGLFIYLILIGFMIVMIVLRTTQDIFVWIWGPIVAPIVRYLECLGDKDCDPFAWLRFK